MKVTITRRPWSPLPPLEVEIGAELEASSRSVQIGAAVKIFVGRERDAGRTPDLSGSNLRGSDLSDSNLCDSNLSGSDLSDNLKGVPIIPHIDAAILAAVEGDKATGRLDMSTWHRCETTHCRAGWAITLAGAGGAALEFAMGSSAAGSLIYAASRPGKRIPDFHDSDEGALADLRAGAAEDPMPVEVA